MPKTSRKPPTIFPEFPTAFLLSDQERQTLNLHIERYGSSILAARRDSPARPVVVTSVADINARLAELDELDLEIEYLAMHPIRRLPPEPLL